MQFHAWENQQHACYYESSTARHRNTASFEALVLEPIVSRKIVGNAALATWHMSETVVQQRKPFVRAPVFAANFGPILGRLAQSFLSHAGANFHLDVPASGAFH